MKLRLVVPPPAVAGEPASGGYRYDEALAAALRARGHDARVTAAPEPGAVHLFDGLGAGTWGPRLREVPGLKVGLVHLPAALLDDAPEVARAEAEFLAGLDAVHFVSARAEADTRARYPLPARTWVAPPGLEHFTPQPRRRERHLVAVGHVLPMKGVEEALALLAGLPGAWTLDWLGALDVAPAFAAAMVAHRDALGLTARVRFRGRVPLAAVAEALARAAALVATSRYESWGLALAEALRAGVPVVGPTQAGVLEFLGGQGARAVEPLRWLTALLDDTAEGRALQAEAAAAGARLPTWAAAAALTERHLEAACAR